VDELYDRALVQPIYRGSLWLWRRLDEAVIDGCVNEAGAIFRDAGQRLRRIQSGYVMNYVLSFLAGVVAILGYLAFRG
jgi:NADH-quinone oxidoreductase subunit L